MRKEMMKRNEALANDIRDFLIEKQWMQDVRIYFNGICYSWSGKYYDDAEYDILEGIDPTNYFKYADRESVSMSFEGVLYEVINYAHINGWKSVEQFENVFKKHNCYYELGNTWNLTAIFD